MPLEIVGHPRSNFVRAVRMVALEKGVQHEHTPELPHSDVIKTLHPMGQIPAMRHEGLELFESMAIARYIDEVFDGPKMVPDEPSKAAKIVQWSSFAQTTVDRLFLRQYVVQHMFNKDKDGNVIRDEIDKAVKSGFYGSDSFSMADCFLLPILNSVQRYPEGKDAVESAANVSAYFNAHSERSSFVETTP